MCFRKCATFMCIVLCLYAEADSRIYRLVIMDLVHLHFFQASLLLCNISLRLLSHSEWGKNRVGQALNHSKRRLQFCLWCTLRFQSNLTAVDSIMLLMLIYRQKSSVELLTISKPAQLLGEKCCGTWVWMVRRGETAMRHVGDGAAFAYVQSWNISYSLGVTLKCYFEVTSLLLPYIVTGPELFLSVSHITAWYASVFSLPAYHWDCSAKM